MTATRRCGDGMSVDLVRWRKAQNLFTRPMKRKKMTNPRTIQIMCLVEAHEYILIMREQPNLRVYGNLRPEVAQR